MRKHVAKSTLPVDLQFFFGKLAKTKAKPVGQKMNGRSRITSQWHGHAHRFGRAAQARQTRQRGGDHGNARDDGPRPPAEQKIQPVHYQIRTSL